MTTNYPEGTTPPPVSGDPNYVPADDAAAGCAWWWWILIIIIIILIVWWAGWGWGPYGGYWFRKAAPSTNPGPATINDGTRSGTNNAPGGTGAGTTAPTSAPGVILAPGFRLLL